MPKKKESRGDTTRDITSEVERKLLKSQKALESFKASHPKKAKKSYRVYKLDQEIKSGLAKEELKFKAAAKKRLAKKAKAKKKKK